MPRLHTEIVATYEIKGKQIDVDLCWRGDDPEDDPDRFYDFYDSTGLCLNEGHPWHDDGQGIPTAQEVAEMLSQISDIS
jgi:hypothetical protein